MKSNREQLFEGYLTNRLSAREKQELTLLLQDEGARADFVNYAADWALIASAARQNQPTAGEAPAAAPASSSRSIRFPVARFIPALAAAAVLLVVTGLFMIQKPSPGSGLVKSVQTIGQVQVNGTRFSTADKSFCRVVLNDGTQLALNQNSSASVSRQAASGATTVTRHAGDFYLDVAHQQNPFFIQSGILNVRVLGTKLHVGSTPAGQPWISVLEGYTHILNGESGAYLRQGQTGIASPRTSGHDFLTVTDSESDSGALSWVKQLSLTPPTPGKKPEYSGLGSGYQVRSGIWRFDPRAGRVVITQEKETGDRDILFGAPQWAKGTITCQFRVLRSSAPDAAVGLLLHYSNTETDRFVLRDQLPRLAAFNTWINVKMEFEIGGDNDMTIHALDFWPEGHPEAKWSMPEGPDRSRTPRNSPIKRRQACNIGLFTSGCTAEFSNLEAGPVYLAPGHIAGIGAGNPSTHPTYPDLIAFYSFKNGSGTLVKDISGAKGDPMDLTIHKPEGIEWLDDAIRVKGIADIRYSGNAQKLRDAWATNGGLTVELWVRPPEQTDATTSEQQRFLCLTTGDKGYIWWNTGFQGEITSSQQVGVDVFALRDEGKEAFVYRVGSQDGTTTVARARMLDMPLKLNTRPEPIGLHLAPSFSFGSRAKHPWKGDILALAIYGRPFTPDELLQTRKLTGRDLPQFTGAPVGETKPKVQ